jgi:glycosyltransferase involved in cell wall biosynthesis
MDYSPRLVVPSPHLSGWLKKWALRLSPAIDTPPHTLFFSSRLASHWVSLGTILYELESALWSLSKEGKPLVRGKILESERLLELEKQNAFDGVAQIVVLGCGPQATLLLHHVRTLHPHIRVIVLVTSETVSLLRPLLTPTVFPWRTDDTLLCLCRRDLALIEHAIPGTRAVALTWLHAPHLPVNHGGEVKRLVYAGRVSPPKNLKVLIEAYRQLKEKLATPPPLYIVGPDENHRQELQALDGSITWIDNLREDDWKNFLQQGNSIYLNASTSMDENHGIAPREWLLAGHRALLSDWGGHADLAELWPARVRLVPVHVNEHGTQLNPTLMAQVLQEMLLDQAPSPRQTLPASDLATQLKEVLERKAVRSPLAPSAAALQFQITFGKTRARMLDRRTHWRDEEGVQLDATARAWMSSIYAGHRP